MGAPWVSAALTRLRRSTGQLGRKETPAPSASPDGWPSGSPARDETAEAQAPDSPTGLIAEIESCALDIYAAHGLPTRPGHYSRSPLGKTWKFIGEHLTAEERWTFALEKDYAKGWKFRSLEDLGAADSRESLELSRASDMLRACRTLKLDLRMEATATQAERIKQAIRLGADWQYVRLVTDRRNSGGLRLSIPPAGRDARPPKRDA